MLLSSDRSHWRVRLDLEERLVEMLILRRLAVWLLETSSEALLLALALIGLFGYDQHAFARSPAFYSSGIVLVSFTTGYLLSAAVARAAWKGQKLWSYPVIATVLFLIHSQIFFVISGGSTRSEKLSIQTAGGCIVSACTLVGSFILRRWAKAHSKEASQVILINALTGKVDFSSFR